MATQVVTGLVLTSNGYYPLSSTITDSTDNQEVKTNATYMQTTQSLGTVAEGSTIESAFVEAKTMVMYCYLLRNGVNICNIPAMGSRTAKIPTELEPVSHKIRLITGDQIVVRTEP